MSPLPSSFEAEPAPTPSPARRPNPLPVIATGIIVVIIIAILAFEGFGSGWSVPEEAKARANPVPVTDFSLAAGRSIYLDRCESCHGEHGDGQGREAHLYSVKPSNFADANRMNAQTDGELFWKITVGNKPMPKFNKRLTEEQRWQVVNFIRTFSR